MAKAYFQGIPCDAESLACKELMEDVIQEWIQRNPEWACKKVLANKLRVGPNTLSHWLSKKYGVTIPAHLVRDFCQVTGSWELHRWMRRAS